MTQENVLQNDIILEHRARMLNLKKYYPFFKLTETSFDTFRQGQYAMLDMGYIVMAVLRFFIEENNFKEKDVTYPEYVDFVRECIQRDFALDLSVEESKDIADYIFDKIKNDGKPFEFGYYDPVDKKRRVSRMKLIESAIRNNTVWYSISADAIEFYLDTKEIKDESRISVQQLLLEKMIRAQNFKGGTQVVGRINDEVERLMLKKKEVEQLMATDVFAGFEAYQEFVDTGMQWFDEEQKLFVKNKELIEAALSRMEHDPAGKTDGYIRIIDEIYELDNQLKVAMNRHGELLRACMDMQKMTDDVIRRNKLSRLRSHCDYKRLIEQMIKADTTKPMELLVQAMLKPKTVKMFNPAVIDECLQIKTVRTEKAEEISTEPEETIVFPDEEEEKRISNNYGFFMKNLIRALEEKKSFTLSWFNDYLRKRYGDTAEKILRNGDYYSFLVNLCQKKKYVLGSRAEGQESFLDAILKEELKDIVQPEATEVIEITMEDETVKMWEIVEISELTFTLVKADTEGGSDGVEES
ncbi:MAG: hypothetical protein ACI4EJ_03085 [Bacteroides sp.]